MKLIIDFCLALLLVALLSGITQGLVALETAQESADIRK